MRDDWTMPLLVALIIVICIITLYPVITGIPITKGEGIVAALMMVLWIIGFMVSYIKEKVDHDGEITELKYRIEMLEQLRKEEKENGKK